jgi:hypothetical protein
VRRFLSVVCHLVFVATTVGVLAACGGSSDSPAGFTPLAPLSPSVESAGPSAQSSHAAASPSPSPSAVPVDASAQAIEAATKELQALYRSPLTRDSCMKDNPGSKACIALTSGDAVLAGGVASFTGGYPDGGGFAFLMGQSSDQSWHYWYGSQQGFYVLVKLPGDVRACGAGDAVAVRSSADAAAPSAGSLDDGATAHAERFLLTKPGAPGASGSRGEGWYQLSSPVKGWVNARNTSDAALGDCKLRDAVEGAPPHG